MKYNIIHKEKETGLKHRVINIEYDHGN